jgi:hypothetical protein
LQLNCRKSGILKITLQSSTLQQPRFSTPVQLC